MSRLSFGQQAVQPESRLDRQLLTDYESDLDFIVGHSPSPEIIAQANWPGEVRGFGPVRPGSARARPPPANRAAPASHLKQAPAAAITPEKPLPYRH